jgi:ADP-heptose:LPS heptosyltransferase
MALRAAKQLYPQIEIHFIARERFASAAKRVPWITNVITLPTDSLLMPVLTNEKTEGQALSDVARWIGPLVKQPWDMIINWSFSNASSYLTGILPGRVKLGYSRRRDSSFSAVDGWSHYIQAIVQGKVSQNIHLTDILTTQLLTALQIHVGDPANDGNTAATSPSFFSLSLTDQQIRQSTGDMKKKWIAIQLGAGQEAKTWDIGNWIKLAQEILKRNSGWGIYLLGGKEDSERARIFMEELAPFARKPNTVISLVGETNFDLWASVVSRCQWLFAGDTAAIHLASVLGTRILNISVGPVRYHETGPYGNGHYVVGSANECQACAQKGSSTDHSCRTDVTPEAAYATWSYGSNEWAHRRQISIETHFQQLGWDKKYQSVRILRSRIRQSNDGGGVVYEPVLHTSLTLDDWTAMTMGHIARSWYCGWVPQLGQEITRESIGPALVQKLRELQEATDVLSQICDQAIKTSSSLYHKSTSLKSRVVMEIQDREELQKLGNTLTDLDDLVDRLAKTHGTLMAFSQMSKVLMHNLKGTDLSEIGKETIQSYQHIHDGVQVLKEWLKHTLQLARPVVIPTSNVTLLGPLTKSKEKELTT